MVVSCVDATSLDINLIILVGGKEEGNSTVKDNVWRVRRGFDASATVLTKAEKKQILLISNCV